MEQLQDLIAKENLSDKIELGGTFCMGKCQQGVCVTVDGEFGPVEGKLVGAELSATGLTWLYEIEGVYGSEDLLAVTDEMERDAVLELQDGSRKPVSLSVRSELGPNFRNICGFAGTLDIDAVIGITAGGVHYDFE